MFGIVQDPCHLDNSVFETQVTKRLGLGYAWGFPTAYVHAFAVHHSTTPTGAKAGSWLLRIRYWLALVSQPFHLSWELPTQLLE